MPEIEVILVQTILVQTMEDSGPHGAKAVAEIGVDSIAPAVRSSIVDATGVRMSEIPFTPYGVWRALNRAQQRGRLPFSRISYWSV